jgi:aspartate-semialdehyde dehydrogenase
MSAKLRVGILGATGTVGQRFVQLLEQHPQFEATALAASDCSEGKASEKTCHSRLPGNRPESMKNSSIQAPPRPLAAAGTAILNAGLLIAKGHFDAMRARMLVV